MSNDEPIQEVVATSAGSSEDARAYQPFINWREVTIPIDALRPFEQNPRTITEVQYRNLIASIIKYGQFKPVIATIDFRLAGGHQRLMAMRELGWETVRVSVPDIELSDEHYLDIVLLDNHNNGQWDQDMLANMFDLEHLRGLGLHDVFNIAPEGVVDAPAKGMVCCPHCNETFSIKGNKV